METTVKVRHSPSRCPYCHESVSKDQAVVCRDCLARHHDGCWDELGNCGSCSSTHKLVQAGDPAQAETVEWTPVQRIDRLTPSDLSQSAGFLGLNQKGLIMFLVLFMTCLPLAFLPWLLPGFREGED